MAPRIEYLEGRVVLGRRRFIMENMASLGSMWKRAGRTTNEIAWFHAVESTVSSTCTNRIRAEDGPFDRWRLGGLVCTSTLNPSRCRRWVSGRGR